MTPILKTQGLTHVYSQGTPFEKIAIDDINLEIQPGQFVGLIGHTGSGKSTFIQHLNGLLMPSVGSVFFDGENMHSSKEKTREVRFQVGLVFQYPEYQLFEETVYKDVAFGPKNMKLSEPEVDERVHRACQFAGVPEKIMDKSPLDISGGQKRRVAIAGVIAMEPRVLILDEPTAGLDPIGRDSILKNISDYHKETGSAVIIVSHSMDDVARIAERIVVFHSGKIALDGSPAEVFSHDKELTDIGLSVPEVTKIAARLRELGAPIHEAIYTMDQLEAALLKLREGGWTC